MSGPPKILAVTPSGPSGGAADVDDALTNLDPMPDLCAQLPDRKARKRWLWLAGSYLPEAHNRCFAEALRYADWQRLVMIEDDMIVHPHVIARCRTHRADVVTGVYFMRRHPPTPVLWKDVSPEGRAVNMNHLDMAALLEAPPGEYPVGAVPCGILSVARHVVELMPQPWFEPSPEALREGHYGGHDLYFSAKARAQGFTIAVDTAPAMYADHAGRNKIGLQNYVAWMRTQAQQQERELND